MSKYIRHTTAEVVGFYADRTRPQWNEWALMVRRPDDRLFTSLYWAERRGDNVWLHGASRSFEVAPAALLEVKFPGAWSMQAFDRWISNRVHTVDGRLVVTPGT